MSHKSRTKASPPKAANHHTQTFNLKVLGAHSVSLVGDFTQWQEKPIAMHNGTADGWHAQVELPPGLHHYRFLVDGKWVDDPECAVRVPNPYGSQDCVCQVG